MPTGGKRNVTYIVGLHRAYDAGLRAGRANESLHANPYKRWEHRQEWERGWLKGQQEDEG